MYNNKNKHLYKKKKPVIELICSICIWFFSPSNTFVAIQIQDNAVPG